MLAFDDPNYVYHAMINLFFGVCPKGWTQPQGDPSILLMSSCFHQLVLEKGHAPFLK